MNLTRRYTPREDSGHLDFKRMFEEMIPLGGIFARIFG